MNNLLLLAVIVFYVVLLYLFLKMRTDKEHNSEILREVLQEKRQITDMVSVYSDELKALSTEAKDTYDKINMIAAEAELELESAGDVISKQVKVVLDEISVDITQKFSDIEKKKASFEEFNQSLEKNRKTLIRLIGRAEKLAKFFNDNIPYEQVLEEIEDKKYMDARHLLANGYSPEEVSAELNLSSSEVKLLVSIV